MNCIVVDDEPLARGAIQLYLRANPDLQLLKSFGSADVAAEFLRTNEVDLIFLDIRMPGLNGIDFSKTVPKNTLIIFTTAYAEYALDGFEVEAIDYLLKPFNQERFNKAIHKAFDYSALLKSADRNHTVESTFDDYFFVKADRKFVKLYFKDILFIEGLKDYVVLNTSGDRIITAMNIKTIHDQLPQENFIRISKSNIINIQQVDSFNTHVVFIGDNEVPIGNAYRTYFFEEFVAKKTIGRQS
ncbi:response regulator transcription factor [Pedobacter frigidisoli]|uniref:Response regulator transcription factor n=1 Tax=Pedobacter frigidisoli TaxID=2530455 RepID=A0A4R0NZE9_9SPHI|nr:LytTR family DNA-binding domain-containing protein [Pedobacter frigidisoli]TCD05933.1 response regulator transcription factor [Pedobacter frigidisoli]